MIGRLAIGFFAFSAVSAAIVACATDPGLPDQQEGSFAKKPHPPAPACHVDNCVTGLEPDLSKGTVVDQTCACTETDFFEFQASCTAQGGVLDIAKSCGTRTASCDKTEFTCIIPPPVHPKIVATECECGDEVQFWDFFGKCQNLGGELTTVFPSGHEVSCTP
jgi:hypothetical protein